MRPFAFKLFCLVSLAVVASSACKARDIHAEAAQLKSQLARDLPVGSSRDDVEQWLDQRGIEHGFVQRDNSIHSIIRQVSKNTYTDKGFTFDIVGDIQIIFRLDDRESLRQVEVKPIFTGP
jgi:hypothetical protein